jgi:D-3-phosphoglycerate dehydrogenase
MTGSGFRPIRLPVRAGPCHHAARPLREDHVTRPKVVVAETIAAAGIEALERDCDVVLAVGADRSVLTERLGDAAGLVVRSATQVDAALIAAAPHLQVIGRAGIGVDNIDLEAATGAGVIVVNAPQANTISAAEHTMALILAQARRIAEADAGLRAGAWERKRLQGMELHGKTLGIIGLGRIGSLVASRAQAFGMRLIGFDPYVSDDRFRRAGVEPVPFERLLTDADIITMHLPRTRDTAGLIDADAIARTKPGVRIVNVSRGGLVDEAALAAAIRDGHVAGAALDVFTEEPPSSSPLFDLPEVVVTPHLGASTREAQDKAGTQVAEAVSAALRGELVLSAVNVDLGSEVSEDVRPYLPVAEHLGVIFAAIASGLPGSLTVAVEGQVAFHPVRPIVLAALKGMLGAVSERTVSYVNAPLIAEAHGIIVREEARRDARDYVSVLRLSGTVGEREWSIAASILRRKGPVLVEIGEHEIELPLSAHMGILYNDDVPGVIGRVGMYLGDHDVNIANMAVGRTAARGAMMGLNLDQPLTEETVAGLRRLEGVVEAKAIELNGLDVS